MLRGGHLSRISSAPRAARGRNTSTSGSRSRRNCPCRRRRRRGSNGELASGSIARTEEGAGPLFSIWLFVAF